MRKLNLLLGFSMLALVSCTKNNLESTEPEEAEAAAALTQRACEADAILNAQMDADPAFRKRMEDLELFTEKFAADYRRGLVRQATVNIPVVVNVVYRSTSENISDAQINSQIAILNQDFAGTNSDFGLVPADFSGVKANVGVSFTLQNIVRRKSSKRSWGTNDDVKRSSRGGIDYTPGALNIWVCTLSNSILGYAQFPGGAVATDGVVLLNRATGNTGTAAAPFNKGRTGTHEVGHWMNLRHIWGDATCGNDFVTDTPPHNTANYGCPAQPHFSTCTGSPREMTMNYMDYTDDACMYMFSNGQKSRMLAVFAAGGPRASFAN